MSDVDTAMAQAHTAAQARKASTPANKGKGQASPARRAAFNDAVQRKANTIVPTLEDVRLLTPTHEQISAICRAFAIDEVHFDSMVATARDITRMEITLMADALVSDFNGEKNYRALEMHMQRIVGSRVSSAYGQANFYETKRQAAKDLSNSFSNADREEDRMGIDGGANRAAQARQFAATLGVKAFALLAVAEGAVAEYDAYFGTPWKPYTRDNARTLDQQVAAAQSDALGI